MLAKLTHLLPKIQYLPTKLLLVGGFDTGPIKQFYAQEFAAMLVTINNTDKSYLLKRISPPDMPPNAHKIKLC